MIHIEEPQPIFCWPNYFRGEDVKKIMFDLNKPPIISLPDEKELIFSSALKFLDTKSFFFVQLANHLNSKEVNQAVKIVWLCE